MILLWFLPVDMICNGKVLGNGEPTTGPEASAGVLSSSLAARCAMVACWSALQEAAAAATTLAEAAAISPFSPSNPPCSGKTARAPNMCTLRKRPADMYCVTRSTRSCELVLQGESTPRHSSGVNDSAVGSQRGGSREGAPIVQSTAANFVQPRWEPDTAVDVTYVKMFGDFFCVRYVPHQSISALFQQSMNRPIHTDGRQCNW